MYEKIKWAAIGAATIIIIFLAAALAVQIVERADAQYYRLDTQLDNAVGANGASTAHNEEYVAHEPMKIDEPMSLDEALETVGVVEFNYDPGKEFSQLEGYVLHDSEPLAFTIVCSQAGDYAPANMIRSELCIHLDGWDVSDVVHITDLDDPMPDCYKAIDDEKIMISGSQLYCLWYLAHGGEIHYVYDHELDEYVPAEDLSYIQAPYHWEPTKRSLDTSGLF